MGEFALTDLTSSSLLALCILLILMGRLVPRSVLRDKDRDVQQWREAFTIERQARMEADSQARELISLTRSTHQIVFGHPLANPPEANSDDVSSTS